MKLKLSRPSDLKKSASLLILFQFVLASSTFGLSRDGADSCFLQKVLSESVFTELAAKTDCCRFEENTAAVRSELFPLYKQTYEEMGLQLTGPDGFIEYDGGYFVARDPVSGKPIAFVAFKRTPFGLKVGMSASNGTKEGKAVVKTLIEARKNVNGVFSESSGKPAYLLFERGAQPPVVSFEDAQKVLAPKVLTRPTAEELKEAIEKGEFPNNPVAMKNAYVRVVVLDGVPTRVIKVMVGRPVI